MYRVGIEKGKLIVGERGIRNMGETRQPKNPSYSHDRRNASVCLTAIGIGYLFPFSALTQPVDYWNYLFPGYNLGECMKITILCIDELHIMTQLILTKYLHPLRYFAYLGRFKLFPLRSLTLLSPPQTLGSQAATAWRTTRGWCTRTQ